MPASEALRTDDPAVVEARLDKERASQDLLRLRQEIDDWLRVFVELLDPATARGQ